MVKLKHVYTSSFILPQNLDSLFAFTVLMLSSPFWIKICMLSCGHVYILFNLNSGSRGVFDAVIEGILQHWKHREIVKVVTMQKKFS